MQIQRVQSPQDTPFLPRDESPSAAHKSWARRSSHEEHGSVSMPCSDKEMKSFTKGSLPTLQRQQDWDVFFASKPVQDYIRFHGPSSSAVNQNVLEPLLKGTGNPKPTDKKSLSELKLNLQGAEIRAKFMESLHSEPSARSHSTDKAKSILDGIKDSFDRHGGKVSSHRLHGWLAVLDEIRGDARDRSFKDRIDDLVDKLTGSSAHSMRGRELEDDPLDEPAPKRPRHDPSGKVPRDPDPFAGGLRGADRPRSPQVSDDEDAGPSDLELMQAFQELQQKMPGPGPSSPHKSSGLGAMPPHGLPSPADHRPGGPGGKLSSPVGLPDMHRPMAGGSAGPSMQHPQYPNPFAFAPPQAAHQPPASRPGPSGHQPPQQPFDQHAMQLAQWPSMGAPASGSPGKPASATQSQSMHNQNPIMPNVLQGPGGGARPFGNPVQAGPVNQTPQLRQMPPPQAANPPPKANAADASPQGTAPVKVTQQSVDMSQPVTRDEFLRFMGEIQRRAMGASDNAAASNAKPAGLLQVAQRPPANVGLAGTSLARPDGAQATPQIVAQQPISAQPTLVKPPVTGVPPNASNVMPSGQFASPLPSQTALSSPSVLAPVLQTPPVDAMPVVVQQTNLVPPLMQPQQPGSELILGGGMLQMAATGPMPQTPVTPLAPIIQQPPLAMQTPLAVQQQPLLQAIPPQLQTGVPALAMGIPGVQQPPVIVPAMPTPVATPQIAVPDLTAAAANPQAPVNPPVALNPAALVA